MKIDHTNREIYWKGFRDGTAINNKGAQTFSYMGYTQEQLDKIISEHEEHKFYSGEQWTEADIEKIKEKQKEVNEKYVDWSKDLQITTHYGTFEVINLGIGWKGKRIVQIEECSIRYPSHDGSLPNVFVPDENGYVVQFDTWIKNKPTATKVRFLTDKYPNGLVIEINGKAIYEFK